MKGQLVSDRFPDGLLSALPRLMKWLKPLPHRLYGLIPQGSSNVDNFLQQYFSFGHLQDCYIIFHVYVCQTLCDANLGKSVLQSLFK